MSKGVKGEHKEDRFFHVAAPDLTSKAKPGKSVTVRYPVSISYNGGTVVNDKWCAGYIVPPPIVPAGYELVDLCVGLELNAHPPMATKILRSIKHETAQS
jgi:hypothetical protein